MRLRGQSQGLQNVSSRTSSRPRTSSRTPPLFAILPTTHNLWLIFANQLWAVHFGTWLIGKLFHSVHKKLRTCGCGLQELQSCGLAIADFKNYEVADLRLRIQESRKVVADLRLRTKLLNVQLRTCGCGLRKLKFGCGIADCGLEKKLAVPSTGASVQGSILTKWTYIFAI